MVSIVPKESYSESDVSKAEAKQSQFRDCGPGSKSGVTTLWIEHSVAAGDLPCGLPPRTLADRLCKTKPILGGQAYERNGESGPICRPHPGWGDRHNWLAVSWDCR